MSGEEIDLTVFVTGFVAFVFMVCVPAAFVVSRLLMVAYRRRVLALMKLIGSGLPAEDYRVVISAITKKAGVLANGARKRETGEAELYESIEEWARGAIDSGLQAELPVQLRAALERSIDGQFGYRGKVGPPSQAAGA